MTMSRVSGLDLIFWHSSKPDILGIMTSSRMRSGASSVIASNASTPSSAVLTRQGRLSR
jgi:hypothetical protein